MMTPFDYAQLYWAMQVPIVGADNQIQRWEPVRIDRYRLVKGSKDENGAEKYDSVTTNGLANFHSFYKPFDNNKKNDNTEEIKVYIRKADKSVETRIYKPAQRRELYALATRAMWGKGSPEEVQITLQLAARFGLVPPAGLQAYSNEGHIGLDCNGFVGNYLRDVLGKNVGPSTLIDALVQSGRPINTIEEIDHLSIYVLGMVGPDGKVIARFSGGSMGHVMITNPMPNVVGGGEYVAVYKKKVMKRLEVVESTGGEGLTRSDYYFVDCKDGIFTVYRTQKKHEIRVRMSRVWV